ncbi:30S ribosomal protein S6 [Patescibacteria group bacterium]|nr:30S ribosomal protein S6 [Patescibacteria group bacterium]MBU4482188.1 30S ribosomal protein S6 [Patescibacteria group bacterium]
MKKYNLFILLPNFSDEEVESAKSDIGELIKKAGAQIDSTEDMGKRKLSYAIKKIRHGFYLNYVINIDIEKLTNLEKELKLNSEILRYELSLYTDKHRLENRSTQIKTKKNNKQENLLAGKEKKKKVSMEELNKKLDDILGNNNNNNNKI